MGCGKSYTGEKLADLLKYRFIDLDDWIEEKAKVSISEIFAREGESAFRLREKGALRDMEQFSEVVVACGGGVPCFFDNMEWMNERGLSIFLDAPPELLRDRLASGREHRPLISAFDEEELLFFIEEKLKVRRPFYEQAKVVFKSPDPDQDITLALEEIIRRFKG